MTRFSFFFLKLQKDIKARELEERNTSALQQLSDMVDSVMGLGPIVTKHLYEKGLQIPPLTGSSIHSDSSRVKGDATRGRRQRRSSHSSNGTASSSSASSSASRFDHAIAKSERTIEKRPSVVTLDFQGDESVRSFQMNRSGTASSKGKNWTSTGDVHDGIFDFSIGIIKRRIVQKSTEFCIQIKFKIKTNETKEQNRCEFYL